MKAILALAAILLVMVAFVAFRLGEARSRDRERFYALEENSDFIVIADYGGTMFLKEVVRVKEGYAFGERVKILTHADVSGKAFAVRHLRPLSPITVPKNEVVQPQVEPAN